MTRSSKALTMLLLLAVVLSCSWTSKLPVAAASGRPLLATADGQAGEVDTPVIVLPSLRRPWHKMPPLEMKPAGHSCETYSPNNKDCPTRP
jgi:hypothetical protein